MISQGMALAITDTMPNLKSIVVDQARACGFDLVRVTGADEFERDREEALRRIRDGHMDGLPWFTEQRVRRGASPLELLPGARSVICLGLSYLTRNSGAEDTGDGELPAGRVARYAWGRDYHRVIKRRMRAFVRALEASLGKDIAARWYVDDGPMLDRAAANRSGLGWFGKNTNILTPSHGSWVFLGQVITDLDLAADPPLKKTCGSCVRCIDDCPTGAIVAPYVVDNSRCISYLTIENRGPIPRELRPLMQDWIFGCDICQDVCPVNRKARPSATGLNTGLNTERTEIFFDSSALSPSSAVNKDPGLLDLVELLEMSEEQFRQRFQGTPLMRAKREGMQRNACVALGNLGRSAAVPALARALAEASPLVRRHAAWALGQIGSADAKATLNAARETEQAAEVSEEIRDALIAVR